MAERSTCQGGHARVSIAGPSSNMADQRRWSSSKAQQLSYDPSAGPIDVLSLSYPVRGPKTRGTVGKVHHSAAAKQAVNQEGPSSSPAKMTHREKYDALIASTARPPPMILCGGVEISAVVKTDPLTGKVSRGFWGPSRAANVYGHPPIDPPFQARAMFLPTRHQSYVLWGMANGDVVYTILRPDNPPAPGGRAEWLNLTSQDGDEHLEPVTCIWAPSDQKEKFSFVSGSADGAIKVWTVNLQPPAPGARGGPEGFLQRTFTWAPYNEGILNPSTRNYCVEVRCDLVHGVICCVTNLGRIQILCYGENRDPTQFYIESEDSRLASTLYNLDLAVRKLDDEGTLLISVLLYHFGGRSFHRYDITVSKDGTRTVNKKTYVHPHDIRLTAYQAFIEPAAPIASQTRQAPSPASPLGEGSDTAHASENGVAGDPGPEAPTPYSEFGRFIVAGDQKGSVFIWPFDHPEDTVSPIRGWSASSRRISAVEYHCGLIAVGAYVTDPRSSTESILITRSDASISVFDPLPAIPVPLRSFRAIRVSAGEMEAVRNGETAAYSVRQILLENDFVVASIGRQIFAWRAGKPQKRDSRKNDKGKSGPAKTKTGRGAVGKWLSVYQVWAGSC